MRDSLSAEGFTRQEFVSVTELAGRTCGLDDCSNPPSATYAMVRPLAEGKVAYEVSWACADHLARLAVQAEDDLAEGKLVTGWLQDLDAAPVCLHPECDQDATHVVFVARDYGNAARRLEGVNYCAEHAAAFERHLRPSAPSA